MIRLLSDRLVQGLVGLVVITVSGVLYLFASVLQAPLAGEPAEIRVRLERTGGLFEGSEATYRGVRVGTVREISIRDGSVEALVELREGVRVPRDTEARVRSLSPVGEQYLDFRPRSDGGPYLDDGDVVKASATDVPVAVAAAADELIGLVEAIDRKDLRTVLRETSAAVDGTGDDLETLLVATDRLSATLDASWPATERLLRNGEVTGELIARHNGDLFRLSSSAKRLARFLRDYDPRFRRLLESAPADLDTVGLLMGDLETLLPPLLEELVRLGELAWDREPHLRRLTTSLGFGARRFASAFRDGWLHVDLNLQGQEHCEYGVGPRDPMSTDRRPVATGGRCRLDDHVWRGAEHAPPPLDR